MEELNMTEDEMFVYIDNCGKDEFTLNYIAKYSINTDNIYLLTKLLNMQKVPDHIIINILSNTFLRNTLEIIFQHPSTRYNLSCKFGDNNKLLSDILSNSTNKISTMEFVLRTMWISITHASIKHIFRKSIYNDDLDIIAFLIENKFNVKSEISDMIDDTDAWRIIKFEIFIFLENHGINLSNYITDIGRAMIQQNNLAGLKYCFGNRANTYSLLKEAVKCYNNLEMSKYLLENGADANSITPEDILHLMWTYLPKESDIIELLIDYGFKISVRINELVIGSIACGSLNILKLLIREGADIHMEHDNLLIYASGFRHIKIIDYLLDNGIDICARNNSVLNFFEFNRNTVVKNIFDNEMWKGMDTPSLDVFKHLLKKGAIITDPLKIFLSYVNYSENKMDEELFLLFVDAGLNINTVTNRIYNRPDIMNFLEKYKED